MYEPSNIYISRAVYKFLIIWVLSLSPNVTYAQSRLGDSKFDTVVVPTNISKTNLPCMDLFVYCAGSTKGGVNFNYYSSNIWNDTKNLYGSFINLGIGCELYRSQNDQWRLGTNLGYKYEKFAYGRELFGELGIQSHWFSTDISIYWSFLCVGITSDMLINSHVKYKDTFTYQGFNEKCFNNVTFSWYGGLNTKFSFAKLEIRAGMYIIPQLNPNYIAYHCSIDNVRVPTFYWEARVSFPIFSLRKFFERSIITKSQFAI